MICLEDGHSASFRIAFPADQRTVFDICRPWFKETMFYPVSSVQVHGKQICAVFLQINPFSGNENRPVSPGTQKDILTAVFVAANQLVVRLHMRIVGEGSGGRKAFRIVFPVIKISQITNHISSIVFCLDDGMDIFRRDLFPVRPGGIAV